MSSKFTSNDRINFIEQVHQEFLHMKGYGTYAYITSSDVNELFDAYRTHQHAIASSITQQSPEVAFIRSYIKSLRVPGSGRVSVDRLATNVYEDL